MLNDDFRLAHCYSAGNFGQPLTPDLSIVTTLVERALKQPDDVYMTAVAKDGAESTLTYGDLDRLTRRLCAWLVSELALAPRDVVGLLPCNDVRSVLTIFALLRNGCAIFFLNPAEPEKRRHELLSGVHVKHLLCATPGVHERVPAARLVPDPYTLASDRPVALEKFSPCGTGAACFIGTSGSTAAAKIVVQTHYNAVANAEALRKHHDLGPEVRILGCLPIYHVNGLHFSLFAPLWAGAHVILLEAFNPLLYRRCLTAHRPMIASVVPSLLESLLNTGEPPYFPKEFRYFVSAAAPLPVSTCKAVLEKFGVRVHQGYGLTETTNFSTTIPIEMSDAAYRRFMIDTKIPSIGVALHGNDVIVLRDDGSQADGGEIGEICMRGHNVMLEYAGNEACTREAFKGGWFHSQDLGYSVYDEESGRTFFFITGRQKNMAKVMGVAVSLEEMERTLLKLPFISDAACFTVPDQLLGEAVMAAIVSAQPLDRERLHAHLGEYFSAIALPISYIHADAIPRTATGKILRAQLPDLVG